MIYTISTIIFIIFVIYKHESIEPSNFTGGIFLISIAVLALYGVGKLYCVEWKRVLSKSANSFSLILFFYEHLILPSSVTLFALGSNFISLNNFFILGILLIIGLGDWFQMTHKYIASVYRGPSELESKKLYLTYPPTARIDLIPMDFLFNVVLFFLVYKRLS